MTIRKPFLFGGLGALVVLGIVASLIFTIAANPSQPNSDLLTSDEAKSVGLTKARSSGLSGDPSDVSTTLTTLTDYVSKASGGQASLGNKSDTVGLDGDKEVWVVAFDGNVELTLPGVGGETFDNITIAMDAQTGEIIGVDAYPADMTVPYRQTE